MLDKSSDLSWESLLWQQANVSPIFPPEELVNYDKLFRIDTLTHTCYSFAQHRIFPRHFEKHLFFFFQRRTIYMETILYVLSTYIFMSLFHFILPTLYYQCVHFHIIFTFDLFLIDVCSFIPVTLIHLDIKKAKNGYHTWNIPICLSFPIFIENVLKRISLKFLEWTMHSEGF